MVDFEAEIFDDHVPDEFMSMSSDALRSRIRLLANEIRVLKVQHSHGAMLGVSVSATAHRGILLSSRLPVWAALGSNLSKHMGVPTR